MASKQDGNGPGNMKDRLHAVMEIILQDGYTKDTKLETKTQREYKEVIEAAEGDKGVLLELWDDLQMYLKKMVLSQDALALGDYIHDIRCATKAADKAFLQKNHKALETFCRTYTEIANEFEGDMEVIDLFLRNVTDHIQDKCQPLKEDIYTLWMPLLKSMVRFPVENIILLICKIIKNGAFKKFWDWKKNWKEAQVLIQKIKDVKGLPEDESLGYWESRNIFKAYASLIDDIVDQFKFLKIEDNVSLDVMEVFMTMMEKSNEFINYLSQNIRLAPLKNYKENIPALMKRFEKMFFDPNYPWINACTDLAGDHFLKLILSSYDKGIEMQDEVNQSFVRIFTHCIEGDVTYVDMARETSSIYKMILDKPIWTFVCLHDGPESMELIESVVPLVKKMIENEEEEDIQKMGYRILEKVAKAQPEELLEEVDDIIGLYSTTHESKALMALYGICSQLEEESSKQIVRDNFQDMFAALSQDDEENGATQVALLYMVAQKMPEVFTEDNVRTIMTHHINISSNLFLTVLTTLESISITAPEKIPPDLLLEKIFKGKTLPKESFYYLTKLAVSVGVTRESYADKFIKELFALCEQCKDPMYCISLVNGARSIAEKYGIHKLQPYRAYLEEQKKNAVTSELRAAAVAAIDAMEKRSLEKVSGDVKQQDKKINVIDKKVTKNTKEVAVVKKNVKKHELQITNVKKGLKDVNERVDEVEEDLSETKVKVEEIDNKTMTNAPAWSRDVTKLMNPQTEHDWRLLASRLGYSNNDIKGWATQNDPCMALLSEWYATHKTIEATHGVLTALQEMNRQDAAAIVENAMKNVEGIVEEAPEYATPPPIFLSYQWGHQEEVKLLKQHLNMAGYECWMDIGQMGGGDKLFEKIDNGIRGAKIIVCCVSEKYAKSPNCNREVNLSVNLGKPMIPLLMEKMGWPPKGSMGPIFSEYLFVRFFQRSGEETKDNRYWPVPKFQELLMQINLEVLPDDALVTKEYKEWWKPVAEEIVIKKKDDKVQGSQPQQVMSSEEDNKSPDVFISYQWGKQPQIKQLYRRLSELGFSCWMDIYQMGGGDSLYDKIDRGVRGCKIILSCVTTKYALSANCRREVSLADSIKKPIIPLLLEKIDWPPTGPMSMVFTQLLFINFYRDENVQMTWEGDKFNELLEKITANVPGVLFIEDKKPELNVESESKSQKVEKEKTAVSENKEIPVAASNQKKAPQSQHTQQTEAKSSYKAAPTPPKQEEKTPEQKLRGNTDKQNPGKTQTPKHTLQKEETATGNQNTQQTKAKSSNKESPTPLKQEEKTPEQKLRGNTDKQNSENKTQTPEQTLQKEEAATGNQNTQQTKVKSSNKESPTPLKQEEKTPEQKLKGITDKQNSENEINIPEKNSQKEKRPEPQKPEQKSSACVLL